MNATIQPNPYRITDLTVRPNTPDDPTLVVLIVKEADSQFWLALDRLNWQDVANQLGALGVVAQSAGVTL